MMHEDFESWASGNGESPWLLDRLDCGAYKHVATGAKWSAWQAATNIAVSRCLVAPVKTGRQDQREACAAAIRAGS